MRGVRRNIGAPALAGAAACAVAGCGRIAFERFPGAAGDASGDAPAPVTIGPFTTVSAIAPLLHPNDDDDPTLTADLLELYFSSNRPGVGASDIWVSKRASAADAWGAASLVPGINTNALEDGPGISADGLTLWWVSAFSGNQDVYVATRATRAAAWSAPALVLELSSAETESCPEPSRDALRILLCRGPAVDRPLFESVRASVTTPWRTPVELVELDAPGDQPTGFLFDDLRVLVGSERAGGVGMHDIYFAMRPSTTAPFGTLELVPGVNSPQVDDDPWLSPDGKLLVFASDRSGNLELWQATR